MKNNTERNDSQQGSVSQQHKLSFYEENYILEPESNDDDSFYYETNQVYNLGKMDFIFN